MGEIAATTVGAEEVIAGKVVEKLAEIIVTATRVSNGKDRRPGPLPCTSAGEPLPTDIGKRWVSAVGGDILDGIGSSGDKFYQTPEGYYVYAGRTDDMLKVSGIYVSPYKYAGWVEFVAELPKTATGKIQRFKLRTINESC